MTSTSGQSRSYPTRPYLAVSAAIFRDGRVLIVRRAQPPAHGVYTLPGGGVELGETLEQAVIREVREETGLEIEPIELAGYRQMICGTPMDGSSGISSFCRLRRAGSRVRFRSMRSWPRRTGFCHPNFPD